VVEPHSGRACSVVRDRTLGAHASSVVISDRANWCTIRAVLIKAGDGRENFPLFCTALSKFRQCKFAENQLLNDSRINPSLLSASPSILLPMSRPQRRTRALRIPRNANARLLWLAGFLSRRARHCLRLGSSNVLVGSCRHVGGGRC